MVTPIVMTAASQFVELVADGMTGTITASDFLLKRIVGSITLTPQAAATATSTVGLAIIRSTHDTGGTRETALDPLDTDVDAGSQDILWQRQLQPQYGGPLDATALDLAFEIMIDIKARGSFRRLNKRQGIQLVHRAETTARVEFTFRLRILSAVP